MSAKGASLERRVGLAALIMSGGVLASRLTGHLREALLVAMNGAGGTTDAYYAAFTLPDLLNYMLAGGALSIAFLPIFAEYLAAGDEDGGWAVFSSVATTMGAVLAALIVIGEVAAPLLVPLLAPGFPPERMELAIRLTRIVMPAQLAFYVGGLVQATLYAREQFWAPALSPLVYNGTTIAVGLLLRPWGVEGFAWGVLVGAFLGPLLLPLLATRRSLRYRFHFSLRAPGLLRFVKLSLPLMLGVSLLSVDQWLARYFASGIAGSITHLDNARRLMLVPTAVLGQAAGMAALPFLARLHAQGEAAEMGRVLGLALRTVFEVTLVAATWMALAAGPLVLLVFGWGRNPLSAVEATATLLVVFSLGIPAWGVQGVAVRGFYARQDTLTPMWISSVLVILSLPLYVGLSRWLGVVGLAWATSLGMALTAAATLAGLRIKGVAVPLRPLLATFARAGLGCLLAGLASWAALRGAGRWLDWRSAPQAVVLLGLSAGAFGLVLLLVARPLRMEGVLLLRDKVLGRLRRRLRR